MSTPHKCPVCQGSGSVYAGQGVGTTIMTESCNACGGSGIIWEPRLDSPPYIVKCPPYGTSSVTA